jgi:hypothetical protein
MHRGRMTQQSIPAVALALFCLVTPPQDAGFRTESLTLRSKSQTMYLYEPVPGSPARPFQIILTSGDLGWIGISVDIAERLRSRGYRTIGFNARAYLASYTGKNSYVEAADISGDYRAIMNWAVQNSSRPGSFVLVGVSEGAGLAVVGMGQGGSNPRCRGIIALGLPGTTSLAWRWSDFPMWITKKDPNEPMAQTKDYIVKLGMPVAMIHSTHDEYDSIEKAHALFDLLPGPKDFLAVNASNHRFSDKVAEVLSAVEKYLLWIDKLLVRN